MLRSTFGTYMEELTLEQDIVGNIKHDVIYDNLKNKQTFTVQKAESDIYFRFIYAMT